jgi:hypothetical protein
MTKFLRIVPALFVLFLPATGQDQAGLISAKDITELNTKLEKAGESASAARKKLAIRRVIREADALIEKHPTAPNRFEALSFLFRSQQVLVNLDNSATNRKALLATSEKLVAAPNEFAALRLDADLLLTQAKSARKGADSHARADALRPLVARYRDTDVEPKGDPDRDDHGAGIGEYQAGQRPPQGRGGAFPREHGFDQLPAREAGGSGLWRALHWCL